MQMIRQITAACFVTSLLVGSAAAQDQEWQAEMAELQSSYEQAWVAGDAETLAGLFTEDAVLWPLSGGRFEGRDEIQAALQQDVQPEAADISSTHSERIGDIVFDVGTFTITLPEAEAATMGAATVEGEYVVVTEETEDGMRISRLIGFPPRRAVEATQ
jgi:uncharacterized protein (TIGR02246 family)